MENEIDDCIRKKIQWQQLPGTLKKVKRVVFTSCFDGINQIIIKDNSITRVGLLIFLISSV